MIRNDSETTRAEAARIISNGGLIAFRTDTFYGLGADPLNAAAVAKIRELKGREESKPILLLISDMDQLERFVGDQEFVEQPASFDPEIEVADGDFGRGSRR